ncbi:MAG: hypothetical protein KA586_09535 [Candidatus Promineofilum sp.]|nr:hypothetical protein [Promineifilum sp.]
MEPVYCPNGHPNRPGTRICMVCRALLPPSTPVVAPRQPPSQDAPPSATALASLPAQPSEEIPPSLEEKPPAKKSRIWLWLLSLLLFMLLCAAAVWSLFYPVSQITGVSSEQAAVVVETVSVPIVVAATSAPTATQEAAPTDAPSSTAPAVASAVSPTAVATITPLPTIVGIVVTPTIAFGPDANFIQNGLFADDWSNGWTRETSGGMNAIEMRPAPAEPGGQVVHLEGVGPGMVRLGQRVVLTYPVESLIFRGRFRLAGVSDGQTEGRSALILRYEDAVGEPIGATVWLDDSADSTRLWGVPPLPPFGPNVSAHDVDETWQSVELPLGQEFAEALPDLNMLEVRQVTIFLVVLGSEECAPAGCATLLEVADLSLTAEGP